MKFKIDKKILIKVMVYGIFIMIAPFAFELVIMADIVGVEAAIAFLFIYGKSVAILLRDRVLLGYNILREIVSSAPHTNYYGYKIYAVSTVSSFLLLWFTGSLLLVAAAWLPSLAYMVNIT